MIFLLILFACIKAQEAVYSLLISEVMYNSPVSGELEYIELYNPDASVAVPLAGWSIPAVAWAWPPASPAAVPPQGFVLVAKNRTLLAALYGAGWYAEARVYGGYTGALSNEGERVALVDELGVEVDWFEYTDSYPWPGLADGLGSSLERLCLTGAEGVAARHAGNWIASPAPESVDYRLELSGSPLKASSWAQCPPLPFSTAASVGVHVSELHYHAVGENLMREQFEFVELWNRGLYEYDLSHHRLHGRSLRYRFPAGTVLAAGARLVVSPNAPALIAAYANYSGGGVKRALGPYDGELGNGGGELVLLDDNGRELERVRWDDAFPWPHAADALGGGDAWADLDAKFYGQERAYWRRGQSLHRVDYSSHRAATQPASWLVADPTPSRDAPAGAYRWPDTPHWVAPIVVELDAKSRGAKWAVAEQSVWLRARTEPWPAPHVRVERVECRYYRDELYDTAKRPALRKAAVSVAAAYTTNGAYECELPPAPAHSVVRYQVWLYYEGGQSERSPRASDPYQWHSYHVPPTAAVGESDAYYVYLSGAAWARLIRNTRDGRVEADGCTLRDAWNAEERVTLVYKGAVADARARHQGSRYNRALGEELSLANWTKLGYVGPALASGEQFQALSWRFKLPPWAAVRGRRELILNKMRSYCTYYTAPLHFGLAERAGLWGHATRMVQLHVNGGYFRYMLEIERPGEDALAAWLERVNRRCVYKPTLGVGHLFKAQGCACDEGPYGLATMAPLPASCQYTPLQRYEHTYARKTYTGARDASHAAFAALLDELNALAVAENDAACQAWFARRFDVNLMLSYMALASWAGVWDDNIHNWYAVQRREDGKWFWVAWDADALYGEYAAQGKTYNATLYEGDGDDIFQKQIGHNVLKTAFTRCHRKLLNQRYADLQASVLSVDSTDALLADAKQSFYDRDWRASFGAYSKPPAVCAPLISKYLVERHGWVQAELSKKAVAAPRPLDLCPDVPDVARRDYNAFYAPSTLALAAYYSYLGHVYVGWAPPRTWPYSAAAGYKPGARRRQTPATVLLARGAELRYSTAAPAAGWQSATFNDASWPRARAPLGYDPRQPSWTFGGQVPPGTDGLWVRTTVALTAEQLAAMTGSTIYVVADNAADVYFNDKRVSSEASENRAHDAAYWNAQVQLGRLPWKVGANYVAAYVINVGDPDDLVFDLEITMSTALAPAATPSDDTYAGDDATVAYVTAPPPTPAGKPYAYNAAADYVLERTALPGSPVGVDAAALSWSVVYTGRDQAWVDDGVAEGKWYAYRLTLGDSPPVVQLVRATTAAEAVPSTVTPTAAVDLTVLWIVLGVLGVLGLFIGAGAIFLRQSRRKQRRAQNINLVASSAAAPAAPAVPKAASEGHSPRKPKPELVGGWSGQSVAAFDVAPGTAMPRTTSAPAAAVASIPSDRPVDAAASGRAHKPELVGGWGASVPAFDVASQPATVQRVLSQPANDDEPIIAYSVGAPQGATGTFGEHQCVVCGNRYPIVDDMHIHMRRRHAEDPRTPWPNGKPHLIISPSSPAGFQSARMDPSYSARGSNFYDGM